jgi:hypothetical protein
MARKLRGIMATDTDDEQARRREEEIGRYRLAAEETLEQLEWCVRYLERIKKPRVAAVIDQNRRHIRRQMSGTGG